MDKIIKIKNTIIEVIKYIFNLTAVTIAIFSMLLCGSLIIIAFCWMIYDAFKMIF